MLLEEVEGKLLDGAAEALPEVEGDPAHVAVAPAERRELHAAGIEDLEDVLAEAARLDLAIQIAA